MFSEIYAYKEITSLHNALNHELVPWIRIVHPAEIRVQEVNPLGQP